MGLIAIVPLPEPGHINPTLVLYRQLVECGHEVAYVTTEEHAPLFRRHNLPVVLGRQRPYTDISQIGFDIELEPAVALVDSTIPYVSLWAWEQRWKVINLSILFPRRYDPSVPPLGTELLPQSDALGRQRLEAAWAAEHRINLERRSREVRRRAEAAGLGSEWIDERAALGAFIRFPELVLAAQQLDFQRSDTRDLFYAGPCVDLARVEPTHLLPSLPEGRPLVYCSFGTQVHRYPQLPERVELVLAAARRLDAYHFVVVSSGTHSELPSNVTVVSEAPQLAMLRRAAVMISHGGINAVSEAVCLGVPLVVMPFDIDQPGNAARVEHGGFGRRLAWEAATPALLADTLQSVLGDEALAERVRALGVELREMLRQGQAAAAFAECWASYQRGGGRAAISGSIGAPEIALAE